MERKKLLEVEEFKTHSIEILISTQIEFHKRKREKENVHV